MTKLFISHSSQDDDFVRELRAALADHRQDVWIDSRELGGGDPLWSDIQMGIEGASAYAVVISTDALQSKWVGKELRYALGIQKERGKDKYPVIPLSLNDTKLGVLEEFFDEEPIYIPITSNPGGIEAAIHPILVALRERLPTDVRATPQPKAEPLEELVLELTDLKFQEHDGVRRASARARLVYEAATPGQPDVYSAQQWRLVAPIGPIEADDLRWYLEQYAVWPSGIAVIQERAQRVEASLQEWGRLLYEAAMPVVHTSNVMEAWAKIDDHAGRRFSIYTDTALEAGAPETEVEAAQEVATILLGLPWELLHDGKRYLFQGARPTRVRRRLPATEGFDVPVVANSRLIALDDQGVTFKYKDYRVKDRWRYKTMRLPVEEFMRRFLLHVLPPGFHRIRHYGLLANAARLENLARARQLLAASISPLIAVPLAPAEDVAQDTPAENARRCPCCGGPMVIIQTFARGHPPRATPAAMGEAT